MGLKVNRLKDFREILGLTQEKLAERVQVSRQTINSIEANRYVPSLELALKLSHVFKCQVEDLFHILEIKNVRKT